MIMTSEGKFIKLFDKAISAEIVAKNENDMRFPYVDAYKINIDLDITTREKSVTIQKSGALYGKEIKIFGFFNIEGQILYAAANDYMPQYVLIKNENIIFTPNKDIPKKYQKGYILRKKASESYNTFSMFLSSEELHELPRNRQFKIRVITTSNGASTENPEIYTIGDVVFNTNDLIDRNYNSLTGKNITAGNSPVTIVFRPTSYGSSADAMQIEVAYSSYSGSRYDVFELEFL